MTVLICVTVRLVWSGFLDGPLCFEEVALVALSPTVWLPALVDFRAFGATELVVLKSTGVTLGTTLLDDVQLVEMLLLIHVAFWMEERDLLSMLLTPGTALTLDVSAWRLCNLAGDTAST